MRSTRTGAYALLGHSLGGIVAFEVTRLLVRSGGPLPTRLFVFAVRAPQLARREQIHDLPEDEFMDKVVRFGGMPDEVLESEDLLSLVLPVVRNDIKLIEEHECSGPPLPVPISAFGGLQDDAVPAADLMAWAAGTTKSFRCRFYPGGHFFLHDPKLPVLADVASDIDGSIPQRAAPSGPWQSATV